MSSTLTSQPARGGRLLDQLRALHHHVRSRASRRSAGRRSWYTQHLKKDTALGTYWNAGTAARAWTISRSLRGSPASVSYVTGTHNVKVGIQDTWGRYRRTDSANGDLRAIFQNGVAYQAQILNTPVEHS